MRTFILLLAASFSLSLHAQTPYLVKDINTTYLTNAKSSAPTSFVAWNGRTYFIATTEAAGAELWSTDGTSPGTRIVADIIPGSASSTPGALVVVNGAFLFTARDVDHGVEFWTTDGSTAGTRQLLDLNPGPSSSSPGSRIVYNNRLLFSADDGASGRELWITDGTAAGTRLLRDLAPGSASSSPTYFVQLGDSVYFVAAGAIWKTDGTDAGTVKVITATARNLRVAGSQLFFEGFTTAANWELWVSDGSEAGTRMVLDILPGNRGGLESQYFALGFTQLGSRVLFGANDGVHGRELWISDGTAAGTRLLRDIIPGSVGLFDFDFVRVATLGNRAFFKGNDEEHGYELWATDGTESGTTLFADLIPGTAGSYPYNFVAETNLYFIANQRLWVSDGTAAGTRVLQGPQLFEGALWPAGGKVYFPGSTMLAGAEPWVTDGTAAGTRMIANLVPDPIPSSDPRGFAATRDYLFFNATRGKADDPNAAESSLWRSDGTEAGTFPVLPWTTSYEPFAATDSLLFFRAGFNSYDHVLATDGTVEGTGPVDDFPKRFGGAAVTTVYPFGDTLFVSAGSSLWKTSAARNAPATALGSTYPGGLIEVAGQHAFYASMGSSIDNGLWITDGTSAGTRPVVPKLAGGYQSFTSLVSAAGTIYFLMTLPGEKPSLWKSDGTFDGTVKVREISSYGTVWKTKLVVAGRKVFFHSNGVVWVSDGTSAGTIELAKVGEWPSTEIIDFKAAGDRALFIRKKDFIGDNGLQYDYDLWTSDGTPEGTRVLKSLGTIRTELGSFDGKVYFAGSDDVHGTELWVTDGTSAETKLLADVNPGPKSSSPYGFTKVRNTLYFAAQSETAGNELWAMPLTERVLSIADARATEGDVARFTVSLNPASSQTVTVGYVTADVAARAGEDYEAASGTLTFAPGQTTKTIEVRVIGDAAEENNETFLVTLRNASGARVAKADAGGIIMDDDQTADVSIAPSFVTTSGFISIDEAVLVANSGPRAATSINLQLTTTPASFDDGLCSTCSIPQLTTGTSTVLTARYRFPSEQAYRSAIVSARERDPQSSNNRTAWTVNGGRTMVMNAAYLTPGGTATITTVLPANQTITSSDPAVVSVPSAITKLKDGYGTFVVTALKPGTSTIKVALYSIVVTVAASGTVPRWPGGVILSLDTFVRFDQPANVRVQPTGRAPLTAAAPTGTIVVSASGQELARRTISGTTDVLIPVYLPQTGTNPVRISYSGDASFLEQATDASVFVAKGNVSLIGGLEKVTGAFELIVKAAGSPVAAPTGTLVVMNGSTELARLTLSPGSDGVSTAHATLTSLQPPSPTVTVQYAGDGRYNSASQQIRYVAPRRHSARH